MPTPEELEDKAAAEAVRELKLRLSAFARKATETWATLDPSPELAPRLATILADQLRQLDLSDVREPIQRAAAEAVERGVTDARTRLRLSGPRRRVMAPIDVIRAVMAVEEQAQEELDKAADLLRGATDADDLQAALARARGSVTRTERTARWSVNRALSEGVRAVAEEQGVGRLWIPERDACLRCLAYAGLYVGPGEAFPGGLTFDTRPVKKLDPVPDPPLHPNCRCRTIPWRTEWGTDYPDSLKREAQRSVLRGWSVPSESERARLRAADALLKRTQLPKSVQDYARRAVRQGEFPRGRDFPRPGGERQTAIVRRRRDAIPAQREAEDGPPADPLAPLAANRKRPISRESIAESYRKLGSDREITDAMVAEAELKDRHRDLAATNPNFSHGPVWQVNCQRVVVAYELRRRGYDVTALPNRKALGDKQYTVTDLEEVWTTPTGSTRRMSRMPSPDVLKAKVASWPPGSRGWIVAEWRAGGAHVWTVEKLADGTVHYIDAQPGMDNAERHFDRVKPGTLRLLRVDDLTPTAEQVGMVKGVS